jgi:hypothetical protein
MQKHGEMIAPQFGLASDALRTALYCDDILLSGKDKEVLRRTAKELQVGMSYASMRLTKYNSNSREILNDIDPSDISEPNCSVLGQKYDAVRDVLEYRFVDNIETPKKETRRTVLRQIAKLYDPCGVIQPFVVVARKIFQQLWSQTNSWDEEITGDLLEEYLAWKSQLHIFKKCIMPRYLFSKENFALVKAQTQHTQAFSPDEKAEEEVIYGEDGEDTLSSTYLLPKKRRRPSSSEEAKQSSKQQICAPTFLYAPTLDYATESDEKICNVSNKVEGEVCAASSIVAQNLKKYSQYYPREGEMRLYVQGDASNYALGVAAYLVKRENNELTCRLVMAKSKVLPIKQVTQKPELSMPRSELLASMTAAQVGSYLANALELDMTRVIYFSDSEVTLGRINKPISSYQMWVSARLGKVLANSTPSQWHYLPTDLMSADLPSRGVSAEELLTSELWWHGAKFLSGLAPWPEQRAHFSSAEDKELLKMPLLAAPARKQNEEPFFGNELIMFFANIERYRRIIRVLTLVRRWREIAKAHSYSSSRLKPRVLQGKYKFARPPIPKTADKKALDIKALLKLSKFAKKPFTEISEAEFESTEHFFWGWIQQHDGEMREAAAELAKEGCVRKGSRLRDYHIFQHEGLIRSQTRMSHSDHFSDAEKHPVLTPRNSVFTDKLIIHAHLILLHAATQNTIFLLNSRFRILGGKAKVRNVIRKQCALCKKPQLFVPQIGKLPNARLNTNINENFLSICCDMCGPWTIRHECAYENCPHPKTEKRYWSGFTCMQTRAIAIYVMPDATTESLLNTFVKLCADKGRPKFVKSDNGLNYVGAERELSKIFKHANKNKLIEQTGVKWSFATPLAPHENSPIESLWKIAKHTLYKAMGKHLFSERQFELITSQVCQVLNSRPLFSTIEGDSSTLNYVTPQQLVSGRKLLEWPSMANVKNNILMKPSEFVLNYRHRAVVLNSYFKIFKASYLNSLSVERQWRYDAKQVECKPGQVVLIMDPGRKNKLKLSSKKLSPDRNTWSYGIVESVKLGVDNVARSATVRLPDGRIFTRSTRHLALMECNEP